MNRLIYLCCLLVSLHAVARPNVVIVLVDDQGYGDLSCHGNPILKTPQMDRLHDESVRFTDFHVAPMCTPTRSQLMSGRDALENGAMNVSSGREMLRRGIPTMAGVFAASGYQTSLFGKWHLGDNYPYRPQDRGFGTAVWYPSSHIGSTPDHWNNDYFDPYFRLNDGSERQFKGYCTDVLFDQAMAWMTQKAAAHEPFFVYLPLNAAHAPLFVPDKYREPYKSLAPDVASFFGMIASVDENLGRLDAMLQKSGLRDDTIVIFMTDNGGTFGVKTFNAGMKGGKITLWEGGHRVPCFIRWPAGHLGQPRDIDELTEVQDVLPTLIDLCELKAPADPRFSGVSLAGLLHESTSHLADRSLVVQFSRMNKAEPQKDDAAVLWKKWRLIGGKSLYDISTDLGEDHDIAAAHPEIVAKLRADYDRWWAALVPEVNVFSTIPVGTEQEPLTFLTPADWQNLCLDQQKQIRTALARNGVWGLDVTQAGTYTIEVRRWPREANTPITAALPAFKGVDGSLPAGKPLPVAKVKIHIGTNEASQDVTADQAFVKFSFPLTPGPTELQTTFYDKDDKEICGGYYAYVWRP